MLKPSWNAPDKVTIAIPRTAAGSTDASSSTSTKMIIQSLNMDVLRALSLMTGEHCSVVTANILEQPPVKIFSGRKPQNNIFMFPDGKCASGRLKPLPAMVPQKSSPSPRKTTNAQDLDSLWTPRTAVGSLPVSTILETEPLHITSLGNS